MDRNRLSPESTLTSLMKSVHRLDHEQPPVVARLGRRYHHIGIPTAEPRSNGTHLEAFSDGVRAAMILVDGAPVELIWFEKRSQR